VVDLTAGLHCCLSTQIAATVPGNPLLLIQKADQPEDSKAIVLKSLRQALSLAREGSTVAKERYGAGTYLSGHTAIQRLYDDLLAAQGEGLEEFRELNPDKGDPFRGLGDELQFLELLSSRRRSAAEFLTRAASLFPETSHSHLATAGRHFRDSAAEAMKAFEIRYGDEDQRAVLGRLFREGKVGDEHPEWVAYWERVDRTLASSKKRKAMADHLGMVITSEREAFNEIERALASFQSLSDS